MPSTMPSRLLLLLASRENSWPAGAAKMLKVANSAAMKDTSLNRWFDQFEQSIFTRRRSPRNFSLFRMNSSCSFVPD